MFYTYAHYTPEGRLFYIGKGGGNGKRAFTFSDRNDYWNRIVKKYGKPTVKILAVWDEEWKALAHEMFLIRHFKELGEKLANMTAGGEGQVGMIPWNKGRPWDEETKLKMSESRKGSPAWNKGIPADPEAIKKMLEAREGMEAWNKGVPCREETKSKLREQRIGKSATWNVGRKHTEEAKKKMSEKLKGRINSDKQKAVASALFKGNNYAAGNTTNRKWKWVGVHTKTGEVIEFLGSQALDKAGFQHANVIKCVNGARKSHKGYTWSQEPIEVK